MTSKIFDWFLNSYSKQGTNIHSNSLSCHLVTAEPSRDAETVADLILPTAGGTYDYLRLTDINNNSSNRVVDIAKKAIGSTENSLITSVDNSTDTITLTAHGLSDNDKILITAEPGATLPSGLNTELYYLINTTTDTFQVSLAEGGSAVNFIDNGSGDLRLHYHEGIRIGTKFIMEDPLWAALTTGDNVPITGLVSISAYTPSSTSQIISYIEREVNGIPTPYTPDGSPFAFDLSTNGFLQLMQG